MNRFEISDDLMDNGMKWVVITAIGLVVICLPVGLWVAIEDYNSPHILLNKDKWECSRTSTYYTPMMAGKVITMIPQTQCDEWNRK